MKAFLCVYFCHSTGMTSSYELLLSPQATVLLVSLQNPAPLHFRLAYHQFLSRTSLLIAAHLLFNHH